MELSVPCGSLALDDVRSVLSARSHILARSDDIDSLNRMGRSTAWARSWSAVHSSGGDSLTRYGALSYDGSLNLIGALCPYGVLVHLTRSVILVLSNRMTRSTSVGAFFEDGSFSVLGALQLSDSLSFNGGLTVIGSIDLVVHSRTGRRPSRTMVFPQTDYSDRRFHARDVDG
jgi:hypothetical protein